jgi:uncharacterized membrane protein
MEQARFLLLVVFLLSGMLMTGLGLPLIFRWVGPNGIYGFRVRRTLADRAVWFAANRYSGCWLTATGLVEMLVAGGLYPVAGLSVGAYAMACGGVTVAMIAAGMIASFRYLGRLGD